MTAAPGPRGLPLAGIAFSYARDPLAAIRRAREEHGPGVVRLPIGRVESHLVGEPALIERILVTDSRDYRKDAYVRWIGEELLGRGLLTSEGDFWLRQRRLAQPAFHRERIAAYGAIIVDEAERLCDGLAIDERRDLGADLGRLTLHAVVRTLFSDEVPGVAEEVGEILDVVMARFSDPLLAVLPFTRRLPLPRNRRFALARARLDAILGDIITRRRASPRGQRDLLAMLLEARDEQGNAMSDDQLRDELAAIFLAGHETISLALTYTFLLLARHPPAGAALAAELDEVLGGRAPTVADVPRLRVTEAVVLESLRLLPPVWAVGREAVRDVELGGVELPAGTPVWFSPWLLHRDARFFDDPEAFRPERWLDGLARRLPRFAFCPFGGGPRQCIGRDYAMLEAVLVLATIARRARLEVEEAEAVRLVPSITLRPSRPILARVR
jgi:cytochrome P450